MIIYCQALCWMFLHVLSNLLLTIIPECSRNFPLPCMMSKDYKRVWLFVQAQIATKTWSWDEGQCSSLSRKEWAQWKGSALDDSNVLEDTHRILGDDTLRAPQILGLWITIPTPLSSPNLSIRHSHRGLLLEKQTNLGSRASSASPRAGTTGKSVISGF